MSVSSTALSANPASLQGAQHQRKSDFKTLVSDVQSGDMSGAQSALAALQQNTAGIQGLQNSSGSQSSRQPSQLQTAFANLISTIQAASTNNGQDTASSTGQAQSLVSSAASNNTITSATTAAGTVQSSFGQDLASLIQSVQAGNLSNAQQDLGQLQSDAKSQSSGGHHHHHHGSAATTATSTDAASSATDAGGVSSSSSSSSASAYAAMMNLQGSASVLSALA